MTHTLTAAEERRSARVTWYRMADSPTYHRANPDADGHDSWTRTGRATCGAQVPNPATFICDPTAPLPPGRRICRNCAKVATLLAARYGRIAELQAWTWWWIYSARNPRQAGVAAQLLVRATDHPFGPKHPLLTGRSREARRRQREALARIDARSAS